MNREANVEETGGCAPVLGLMAIVVVSVILAMIIAAPKYISGEVLSLEQHPPTSGVGKTSYNLVLRVEKDGQFAEAGFVSDDERWAELVGTSLTNTCVEVEIQFGRYFGNRYYLIDTYDCNSKPEN